MAVEKDPARLEILKKIDELERKQLWTQDVEDDPETIPLDPKKIDYLRKKPVNHIKMKIVNSMARKFIKKLMKENQLIIKDVKGIETFARMKYQGAVITCNHFNPWDNLAIYKALEKYIHKRELWKVIREGNYTSMPGVFGLFFRNCNTLPLSTNFTCMKKFMAAVSELLKKNEKILVYPEQGMWWNYKKPRPCVPGAYKFAVSNNVPVIPLFITMEDSEFIGADGFPVQEYTIHVLDPIYPDENKTQKENIEYMRVKNYEVWKEVYEKTYGIPLTYLKEE